MGKRSFDCTSFERGIRFADWMASRRTQANVIEIMEHFEISRATAHRWLNNYLDARGLYRIRMARFGRPLQTGQAEERA